MPRSGPGVYTLPGTYEAVSGETILAAQHNDPLEDLQQDANTARPIVAGGTGQDTAVEANDALNTTSNNMASASTVDLSAATGKTVNITGTTTITALGTVASGAERDLIFAGILTLTHNATSLILPGAANITTAAGDVARMKSKGSGNWVCVGYQRASGAPLAGGTSLSFVTPNMTSPAITGATTMTDTGTTLLTVTSTDAGAGAGPIINLIRDSASPAVNDFIGTFTFLGRDSGGASQSYAQIDAQILDPTAASEDGRLRFVTTVAGAPASRVYIGAGLYTASATGGDKGADTINAAEIYKNGARLLLQQSFESTQQTITTAGSLTLAHGLGVSPKLIQIVAICTTADRNYSVNDELVTNPSVTDSGSSGHGVALTVDATNLNVRFSAGGPLTGFDKTTGVWGNMTQTSWKMVFRAWA